MQNGESTPEHVNPVKSVNALSLPRTAIAMVIIGLTAGILGYVLGTRTIQNASKTTLRVAFQPSQTVKARSNMAAPSAPVTRFMTTADWKTYTNQKYFYQIKYPPDTSYETLSTSDYGYTEFLLGCFRVFVVPPRLDNEVLQDRTSIPWQNLNELENAAIGSTTTYSADEWETTREPKEPFRLKMTYKRLPNRQISGINWNAFEITSNFENHTDI
jgi:hypothetical protein